MANQKYYLRYSRIIYRIKKGDFPNLETILQFLSENDFEINKRTFKRDLDAILELFDIEILYDRKKRGYYVKQQEEDFSSTKLQESLDLFCTIKVVEKGKNIISFENRKSKGIDKMPHIADAINNRRILGFKYVKYQNLKISNREVEPYSLKESQGRWYLVAKDKKDNKIKTFGLDRMSHLFSTNSTYVLPRDFSVEKMFYHSFGVINTNTPENISLEIRGANAHFIKSYPLHHSQKVIKEYGDIITFSLIISITEDFIMELMKYGASINVLSPQSLKKRLLFEYKKAIEVLEK